MVKSTFRKGILWTFFVLAILAFISGFLCYAIISIHFFNGHVLKSSLTKVQAVIFICVFSLTTLLILKVFFSNPMAVKVDANSRTILFTNIFFKTSYSYSFSDFDYYIETLEYSRLGTFKAIYLAKDRKLKRAIRGFYYSNIDEMRNALESIPSEGFKKFGQLRSLFVIITKRL